MAITNVYERPYLVSQVYNPIICSFISDKIQEPDFKYVVDVYLMDVSSLDFTKISRIKQRPNPGGVGMIDLSSIAQNYTDLANYEGVTRTLTSTPFFYMPHRYFEIKVGEEYSVSGTLTLFDGSGTEGEPAYVLGNYQYNSNSTLYPLPGFITSVTALDWNDYMYNLSAKSVGGGEYMERYYPIPANPDLANFLTRNTGTNYVARYNPDASTNYNYADPFWVTFWANRGSTVSSVYQISDIYIEFYEEDGTLISTKTLENRTGNGGGPASTYPPPSSATTAYYLWVNNTTLNVNLSSIYLSETYASVSPVCSYYLVYMRSYSGAYTQSSNPIRVDLVDYCDNELYDRIRLGWLNDLGGFDFFNFTKYYEKTTESRAETWDQTKITWNSTQPYYYGTGNPFDINKNNKGGTKVYNKTTTVKYRMESDWVTQEELDFLGGIAESPLVYAWTNLNGKARSTDVESQYGYTWFPEECTVDNLTYSYKNVKQQKLVQASFDITINKINKKQDIV